MSKRTSEAERQFGDALRAQAFTPKATPDYKAVAHARKVERRWMRFGQVMATTMAVLLLMEVAPWL